MGEGHAIIFSNEVSAFKSYKNVKCDNIKIKTKNRAQARRPGGWESAAGDGGMNGPKSPAWPGHSTACKQEKEVWSGNRELSVCEVAPRRNPGSQEIKASRGLEAEGQDLRLSDAGVRGSLRSRVAGEKHMLEAQERELRSRRNLQQFQRPQKEKNKAQQGATRLGKSKVTVDLSRVL